MDDWTALLNAADCPAERVEEIRRLYEAGEMQLVLVKLKRHRCMLMDALHERQEQVDCLDVLLREIESTIHQTNKANATKGR